jgi:hypothetical protein
MTFLETWLTISPDGGNGAAEAMLAGGLLLLVASYWGYRRAQARRPAAAKNGCPTK